MAALYTIIVKSNTGDAIADLTGRYTSLRFSRMRNRPDLIEMTFDLDDIVNLTSQINVTCDQLFRVNQNELHIYRNGVEIFAGQIDYSMPMAGVTRTLDIQASGWLQLLSYRLTSESYTATDLGAICWDMIEVSQAKTNGDFGITEGTIQTSRTADRNYDDKNILDALIENTEVIDAGDLEVTYGKVFNYWYPSIGQDTSIVMSYPGNIRQISAPRDGRKMANYIISNGFGSGTDRLRTTQEDLVNQASYGLREKSIQFPDVTQTDTSQAHADEELRVRTGYFDSVNLQLTGDSPQLGSYGIGDRFTIQVTGDLEIFGYANGIWKIDGFSVNIDETGVEDVTWKVTRP